MTGGPRLQVSVSRSRISVSESRPDNPYPLATTTFSGDPDSSLRIPQACP